MVENTLTLFAPLPGFHSQTSPLIIGTVSVRQLDLLTWLMLEKSQYADDLIGDVRNGTPFFSVLNTDESSVDDTLARTTRIVHALRLLKPGRLYDPADFVAYATGSGGLTLRYPHRFGRKLYDLGHTYVLEAGEETLATVLLRFLDALDAALGQRRLQLAESLFQQSYEPAFRDSRERMLVLLGCIEALVEDDSMLTRISWPDATTAAFFTRYRSLRNVICHGSSAGRSREADTLESIARLLLRAALSQLAPDPTATDSGARAFLRNLISSRYDLANGWLGQGARSRP